MNKLERITLYALCAIAILVVAGCMTPEQVQGANETERAYRRGELSYESYRTIMSGLESSANWVKGLLWMFGIGLPATGVATAAYIQKKRGPPEPKEMRAARIKAAKAG